MWVRLAISMIAGAIIGAGGSWLAPDSRPGYVASTEIYQRLTFDELWATAPPLLMQTELQRRQLDALRQKNPAAEHRSLLLQSDLLNDMLRYFDQVLFKFVIDEAHLTGENHLSDEQRIVSVVPGFNAGLAQQRVKLTVISGSEKSARDSLNQWREAVLEGSKEKASASLASWYKRKADAFTSISNYNHLSEACALACEESAGIVAKEFLAAADASGNVIPYLEQEFEDRVVPQQDARVGLAAMWALLGALVAPLLVLALRRIRV